jgi:hypothetical protein
MILAMTNTGILPARTKPEYAAASRNRDSLPVRFKTYVGAGAGANADSATQAGSQDLIPTFTRIWKPVGQSSPVSSEGLNAA